MTPREFKAWFDGFTEAISGVPTKAQWARIKERVGEIDGNAVTERVFYDRYWSWPYHSYPRYTSTGMGVYGTSGGAIYNTTQAIPCSFDSTTAMNALGKVESSQ